MIEREPVGEDDVADLILLNYKAADFVGHKYGPDSDELRVTLGEMDRNLARMLRALETRVRSRLSSRDNRGPRHAVGTVLSRPPTLCAIDRRSFAREFDPDKKQLVTSYEAENRQIFIDEERLSSLGLTLSDLSRFLSRSRSLFDH